MADYHRMWEGIQASGRPMILTVEGRYVTTRLPAHIFSMGSVVILVLTPMCPSPPADIITHGGYGNAKRVGHDISPSWGSMISLVDIGSGLWPFAVPPPTLAFD